MDLPLHRLLFLQRALHLILFLICISVHRFFDADKYLVYMYFVTLKDDRMIHSANQIHLRAYLSIKIIFCLLYYLNFDLSYFEGKLAQKSFILCSHINLLGDLKLIQMEFHFKLDFASQGFKIYLASLLLIQILLNLNILILIQVLLQTKVFLMDHVLILVYFPDIILLAILFICIILILAYKYTFDYLLVHFFN